MKLETGNLNTVDGKNIERRGWFVGSFIPKGSMLHSDVCEIKWAKHKKGLKKTSGNDIDENTRTVVVLISGKWSCVFPKEQKKIILSEPGDYVIYDGAYHENEAIEDSHVMVIRWKNK